MDNFIVSARKYRPMTFDTVVGQQSITNTLKNAIRNNQLAQAFLFCGPRGVGKTTCARILAKTINCENPTANIEPCNECTSCKTFIESSSFNIHELDAASNNSVDDIRNLVEQVRIPPQMGRYKVYIIDEVHMLSTQAFNAFLKTLEEPPAYAKFILATTEKHKIIPTILSRCQIFDFKRITVQDIASHLDYVAQKEAVEADPEAMHIIAQKADGALRDALSMFDQMVNLGDRRISRELVLDNLNVLDYDYYFRITDHMLIGNYREALLVLNDIYEKGFEGQHFISGMGEHLRSLLMCKDPLTVKLIESSDTVKEKYLRQANIAPVHLLINALDINNKCDVTYRSSGNKRLNLEIALIQMCQLGKAIPQETPTSQPIPSSEKPIPAPTPTPAPAAVQIPPPAPTPVTPPQQTQSIVSKEPETPVAETRVEPAPVSEAPVPVEIPPALTPSVNIEESAAAEPEEKPEPLQVYPVSSMHSIKNVLQQGANVAAKPEASEPKITRDEPFTSEQVKLAIQNYADQIKDQSALLFTALTAHQPVSSNRTITITLDNAILQKELNDSWVSLLGYLKNALQNDLVEIKVEIATQPTEVKRFMSEKDKLEAMVQKNPNIATLTDQLNLELDIP